MERKESGKSVPALAPLWEGRGDRCLSARFPRAMVLKVFLCLLPEIQAPEYLLPTASLPFMPVQPLLLISVHTYQYRKPCKGEQITPRKPTVISQFLLLSCRPAPSFHSSDPCCGLLVLPAASLGERRVLPTGASYVEGPRNLLSSPSLTQADFSTGAPTALKAPAPPISPFLLGLCRGLSEHGSSDDLLPECERFCKGAGCGRCWR